MTGATFEPLPEGSTRIVRDGCAVISDGLLALFASLVHP